MSGGSAGSSGVASSSGNTNEGGTSVTSDASTSAGTGSAGPSGASASASAGVGSTNGADASAPDGGGDDATVGGNCQTGDTKPCSSFTTAGGMTIQLGPYGAQMDVNVGKGFTNAVQSGDMLGNAATCSAFVNSFGEDPKLGAQLLETTVNGVSLDFSLYTVYRPASWPDGTKSST